MEIGLCFPMFVLFIACCPHPDADLSLSESGCPEEYHGWQERCCKPNVVHAVFAQLGGLTAEEVDRTMPGENYETVIKVLASQMQRYVRDSHVHSNEAWRLLTTASVRSAMLAVDRVKQAAVSVSANASGAGALLLSAHAASRQVGRALVRLENLQQYMLGVSAFSSGVILEGLDPEAAREAFSPMLPLYTSAVQAHDLLVYGIVPKAESAARPKGASRAAGRPSEPTVSLLAVSLGSWAKTGFITIWSLVQHTSARLQIFVIGDQEGLDAWRAAAAELRGTADGASKLRGVDFLYIDFMAEPRFQAYLRRYPSGCDFGSAGRAILARVVCHELLPPDVDRVIALDMGDLLVLDDIRGLWDLGDLLRPHQLLAAADAGPLHHINGGLVLYDVRRMRERDWSSVTLRAAEDGLRRTNAEEECLRDQSIINTLHSKRREFGYEGPSPVMVLPCRWSLFPVVEWQVNWDTPRSWLPEVFQRKRYPGIVSSRLVEVYCPDEVDMLSAWAFIPMTEGEGHGESRQGRVRQYAIYEGQKTKRYCSHDRQHPFDRCCRCGEVAAVVHVAGDMKSWPAMQNLLRFHSPPWREQPVDGFAQSASRSWWGGERRSQIIFQETQERALLTAKRLGFNAYFERCTTLSSFPDVQGDSSLAFYPVDLGRPAAVREASQSGKAIGPKDRAKLRLPLDLQIDTSAPHDAHVLLGLGGATSGLELAMGTEGGTSSAIFWTRSGAGWQSRGQIMNFPGRAAQLEAEHAGDESWAKFRLRVLLDGRLEVSYGSTAMGSYLTEDIFKWLSTEAIRVSVAAQGRTAKWSVCLD